MLPWRGLSECTTTTLNRSLCCQTPPQTFEATNLAIEPIVVEVDPIATTERRRGILGPELQTRTVRQTKPTLVAALRIPNSSYTINFADQGGFWNDLAKQVVNQFERWANQNRSRLKAQ